MIGVADSTSIVGWTSTDQVGTSSSPIDPKLYPLGDYGGPTQTMALQPDSPAYGAGSASFTTPGETDQRGLPRVSPDGHVDIGAYQVIRANLTQMTSTVNPSVSGEYVLFTTTVTPLGIGTVTFYDDSTGHVLGFVPVSFGGEVDETARLRTSSLSVGSHSIRAVYTGDDTTEFAGSHDTSTLVQTVAAPTPLSLQAAINFQLQADPSATTFIFEIGNDTDAHAVVAAVNRLGPQPTPITVEVDLAAGTYSEFAPSPPPGVTLRIVGSPGTIINGQSPAMTVAGGNVSVTGVTMTTSTDAPTVLVQGGNLTLRNDDIEESTGYTDYAIAVTGGVVDLGTTADPGQNRIDVNGTGGLISNTGPNPITALGDTFLVNGTPLTDPFQIQDKIFDDLDVGGGGLVTYVANNVYVTPNTGSIQRGIDAVPVGGTVNVETGSYTAYADYSKLLTVAFADGSSLSLQTDPFNTNQTDLIAKGKTGNNSIAFDPGMGGVKVSMNNRPAATFAPTGRLVAYGGQGNNTIGVITLFCCRLCCLVVRGAMPLRAGVVPASWSVGRLVTSW